MKWKKKLAAVVFALLMLVQTVPPTEAQAAKNVYFTAINDNILPLSDETMPFWWGGYLYIAGSVFTGYVRENTGISYTYNASKQMAALYASGKSGKSLAFNLNTGYTQDHQGNIYNRPALKRGGEVFVQAAVVAEYFGLKYSVISVENGHLVWLREPDANTLSDATFADAASYTMRERYDDYIKGQSAAQLPDTPEGGEVFEGKRIYLCFRAADPLKTTSLLDTLDRQGSQAAFFCTAEFLKEQDDLLRRMTATGQSVGIHVDGDSNLSALEQVEQANRALYQATCGMTRLVFAENVDGQTLEALRQAGYSCLQPDMNSEAQGLQTSGGAGTLLQRVSAQRGDISVWLGESAGAVGLRAFLTAAQQSEDACIALVETVA